MKISKATIAILKNFASINPSMIFQPGNTLRTITAEKSTIFAYADVAESFPKEAGIYDLPTFLNVLGLFSDPDVTFDEKCLYVNEDDYIVKYEYCSTDLITGPPATSIKSIPMDGSFVLQRNDFNTLLRSASVMGLEDMFITEHGEGFTITMGDGKNSSANNVSLGCSNSVVKNAAIGKYHVKVENLKMIPWDYRVSVSKKALKFERVGEALPLVYYVATVPPKAD